MTIDDRMTEAFYAVTAAVMNRFFTGHLLTTRYYANASALAQDRTLTRGRIERCTVPTLFTDRIARRALAFKLAMAPTIYWTHMCEHEICDETPGVVMATAPQQEHHEVQRPTALAIEDTASHQLAFLGRNRLRIGS